MLKPVTPYLQRRKQGRTIHLCPEDCGRQCLAGSASRQKPLAKQSMAATAKVDSFVGDPHPALPYPSTCGVETSKARSGVARSAGWGRSSHDEAAPHPSHRSLRSRCARPPHKRGRDGVRRSLPAYLSNFVAQNTHLSHLAARNARVLDRVKRISKFRGRRECRARDAPVVSRAKNRKHTR
jgi:hypothetical protein